MTAKYRIRVRGAVDKAWSDYFGHLAITVHEDEDQCTMTTLDGEVPDQVSLMGILYRLHGMGLQLLSLERLAAIMLMLVLAALAGTIYHGNS